jgi:hypothetical protein
MLDRTAPSYFGFIPKPPPKVFNNITCQPGFMTYGCHCKYCRDYRAAALANLNRKGNA